MRCWRKSLHRARRKLVRYLAKGKAPLLPSGSWVKVSTEDTATCDYKKPTWQLGRCLTCQLSLEKCWDGPGGAGPLWSAWVFGLGDLNGGEKHSTPSGPTSQTCRLGLAEAGPGSHVANGPSEKKGA